MRKMQISNFVESTISASKSALILGGTDRVTMDNVKVTWTGYYGDENEYTAEDRRYDEGTVYVWEACDIITDLSFT